MINISSLPQGQISHRLPFGMYELDYVIRLNDNLILNFFCLNINEGKPPLKSLLRIGTFFVNFL